MSISESTLNEFDAEVFIAGARNDFVLFPQVITSPEMLCHAIGSRVSGSSPRYRTSRESDIL